MTTKIDLKLQKLWLIEYESRYGKGTEMASETLLDYYGKYHKEAVIKILDEITYDLSNVEVFRVGTSTARCYVRHDYEVHSRDELTPRDFDILRALNTFMGGQRTGDMVSCKNLGNKFVYHLVSECDSSD